jgi:DNA-binding XRE family transcriptional regulator
MPRRKPTDDDLKGREVLAQEFIDFRKEFLFNQKQLAERLEISRRTIQMIEAAKVSPHPGTIRSFRTFKAKFISESAK